MNIELNTNSVECIKEIVNFTGKVYRDICTNTEVFVPFGTLDMFSLWLLIGAIIFVILLMAYTVFSD